MSKIVLRLLQFSRLKFVKNFIYIKGKFSRNEFLETNFEIQKVLNLLCETNFSNSTHEIFVKQEGYAIAK